MVADILETQGARASATMILTKLNRYNSVSAREGFKEAVLGCFKVKVWRHIDHSLGEVMWPVLAKTLNNV